MLDLYMKLLGVLVVFDLDRAIVAINKFRKILSENSDSFELKIVSNNELLDLGDLKGSNISAEFSGWDEGLFDKDWKNYDAILLANDTFCTRRVFDGSILTDFFGRQSKVKDKQYPYIVGEVSYSINYSELFRGRRFLMRWIRTSIFLLSSSALEKIHTIGLTQTELRKSIDLNVDGGFVFSPQVSWLIEQRINKWLLPESLGTGWYRAKKVTSDILLLKAKCVFQELNLVTRCETSKVTVIDWCNKKSLKKHVLNIMYLLQEKISK